MKTFAEVPDKQQFRIQVSYYSDGYTERKVWLAYCPVFGYRITMSSQEAMIFNYPVANQIGKEIIKIRDMLLEEKVLLATVKFKLVSDEYENSSPVFKHPEKEVRVNEGV